jgi:hypothetical protein
MNQTLTSVDGSLEALLGQVAEEYTARLQRGETPDIEEYTRRHPQLADVLRQVLPALQVMGAAEGDGDAPSAGRQLGDFRLMREVGRGGMGIVYEAEQISLGRRVALKVLPLAGTLDPRRLQRFQNEARAAACLHHNHIAPVYFVGSERGVHFYAMQLIEGQTLEALIRDMQPPAGPPKSAVEGVASAERVTVPTRRHLPRKRSRLKARCRERSSHPAGLKQAKPIFARWRNWGCRRPRRWSTPTRRAWSIAMSSRATSWWTARVPCG